MHLQHRAIAFFKLTQLSHNVTCDNFSLIPVGIHLTIV